ncbi:RNA-directed DNA polymerase from mobile element jockey [Eumeta japonica]|uniref:RNA-directed DNA polymerase from mobile element jockey n=1 Tax=Eumeta variegata TaxID=151549 RepID=A0A4C1YGN3_EUMVA|nr:RNA-directed DNA polymerase from mobile element jockey [Eumeta japonica]
MNQTIAEDSIRMQLHFAFDVNRGNLATSYRPISLLSGLSKLFEHFCFWHENSISAKRLIRAGVPQGSSHTLPAAVLRVHKRHPTSANRRPDRALRRRHRPIPARQQFSTNYSSPSVDHRRADALVSNLENRGTTLDKHLHFKNHIKHLRKNAQLYISRLSGIIGRRSKMSLRNKCTLYKICIRPVMTYAAPVFAHANPNTLYQLHILQKSFRRTLTPSVQRYHLDELSWRGAAPANSQPISKTKNGPLSVPNACAWLIKFVRPSIGPVRNVKVNAPRDGQGGGRGAPAPLIYLLTRDDAATSPIRFGVADLKRGKCYVQTLARVTKCGWRVEL